MHIVKVAAAVIWNSFDNTTKIFATARGDGDFKGKWEFPGGKVEVGETSEQALFREIKEELDVVIEVGKLIDTIEYDYPTFHLSMDCFWCNIVDGKIVLNEAEAARWLNIDELYNVDWLPADKTLIDRIAVWLNQGKALTHKNE